MSKKIIYNKHLEKGKFYVVNKHPGLIVLKNDRKNIYIAIVTGTSRHRHQTKLRRPTEPGVKESFVNNRPVQGKRKHFGSKELTGMKKNCRKNFLILTGTVISIAASETWNGSVAIVAGWMIQTMM